jgi:hypothetical protein
MKIANAFLIAAIVAVTGVAHAGGSEGSIGVGGEKQLNGLSGVSVNYDAGKFHVGGLISFDDPAGRSNTSFGLGGRFFWHLHTTASSDFSVGAQLGYLHSPDQNPLTDTSLDLFYFEPALQLRAFITPNVAISATAGLTVGFADASGVTLGSQISGGAGIHYYFF